MLEEFDMENVLTVGKATEFKFAVQLHLAKALAITCVKIALLGLIAYNIVGTLSATKSTHVIPVKLEQVEPEIAVVAKAKPTSEAIARKRTANALTLLGCPEEKLNRYTLSCVLGAQVAKVDPVLIACLMWTESRFNPTARSSMGYKGVMQTPTSTGYVEADTMHGCNKLRDHLQMADGVMVRALTNYKGSKKMMILKNGKMVKSEGYKQALEVLELYHNMKRKV